MSFTAKKCNDITDLTSHNISKFSLNPITEKHG